MIIVDFEKTGGFIESCRNGDHPVGGISELKIRRRRDSTTADLVEGVWGEVAVAMARKIALRKLARRWVLVAPFPVEV